MDCKVEWLGWDSIETLFLSQGWCRDFSTWLSEWRLYILLVKWQMGEGWKLFIVPLQFGCQMPLWEFGADSWKLHSSNCVVITGLYKSVQRCSCFCYVLTAHKTGRKAICFYCLWNGINFNLFMMYAGMWLSV